MTRSTFNLGSISTGTLRSVDLAEAFCAELADRRLLSEATRDYPEVRSAYYRGAFENLDARDPGTLDLFVNDAAYFALNADLPDYVYFGSHPGDGADYGYWVDWETVEEDTRSGELPSGEELPDHNVGLFAVISDHGNVTLYDGSTEVWSIV